MQVSGAVQLPSLSHSFVQIAIKIRKVRIDIESERARQSEIEKQQREGERERRHTSCASRTSPFRGANASIRRSTSSSIFTLRITYSYIKLNKVNYRKKEERKGMK